MDLKSKFEMMERLATKLEHRLKQVQELGMKSTDIGGVEELIALVAAGDRVGTIRHLKTLTGLGLPECREIVIRHMPGRELHPHEVEKEHPKGRNGNDKKLALEELMRERVTH